MSHHNHDHHVDDLSGFSLFRIVWPGLLLLFVIFVSRNFCNNNCCKGGSCSMPSKHEKSEMPMHDAGKSNH